jgi:hypothetical protein
MKVSLFVVNGWADGRRHSDWQPFPPTLPSPANFAGREKSSLTPSPRFRERAGVREKTLRHRKHSSSLISMNTNAQPPRSLQMAIALDRVRTSMSAKKTPDPSNSTMRTKIPADSCGSSVALLPHSILLDFPGFCALIFQFCDDRQTVGTSQTEMENNKRACRMPQSDS